MRQPGKAGQVKAWGPGGTARPAERVGLVIGIGVGVESDAVGDAGHAPADVEAALAGAGIDGVAERRSVGKQVANDRARCEGVLASAIEERPAREAEFQIFGGVPSELLAIEQRARRKLVPRKLTANEVRAPRAEVAERAGQK